MGTQAANRSSLLNPFEQIQLAREIIHAEGSALLSLAQRIDREFCRAADQLYSCQGSVIVCGMGKAGLVGQKIAATMASTGTRSHFLHPGEAVHGDLGRVHRSDIVLFLSQSGETEEVVRLLPLLSATHTPVIAMTGHPDSTLAKCAEVVLDLGHLEEAGTLGLAPSTSTTAMLALGDALALVTSHMRQFGAEDFARFHPGGSLGRKLARVDDVMRPLSDCRVSTEEKTVRTVLVDVERPGRRSGAVLLTNCQGKLTGIFTDSDLVRLLESQRDDCLDRPIYQVMTQPPTTVDSGTRIMDAVVILAQRKFSELPVVDQQSQPLGLIDITDIVGVLPEEPTFSGGEQPITKSQPLGPNALCDDDMDDQSRARTIRLPRCD